MKGEELSSWLVLQWVLLTAFVLLTIDAWWFYSRTRTQYRLAVASLLSTWTASNIAFYIVAIFFPDALSLDAFYSFSAMTKLQGVVLVMAILHKMNRNRE
jgi:hypothetical protein